MNIIIAQVFGITALIASCVGYFFNDKFKFLIVQIVVDIFYAASFLMVGAYSAGIITLVSIFRIIYIFIAEKKNLKNTFQYLQIFILIYTTIGVVCWKEPFDFIPIITSSLFTMNFAIKDLKKLKLLLIVPNVILILYNILVKTYSNALLDLIDSLALIVAVIKSFVDSKKKNELANKKWYQFMLWQQKKHLMVFLWFYVTKSSYSHHK